mgnify:CR=1 FL=1
MEYTISNIRAQMDKVIHQVQERLEHHREERDIASALVKQGVRAKRYFGKAAFHDQRVEALAAEIIMLENIRDAAIRELKH